MPGLAGSEGAEARYRLLVRSIGTADAAVIASLRPLHRASDVELAALLYRAPSELLPDIDRDTGRSLAEVLRSAGVDVELVRSDEAFQPGVGDLEIALAVKRFEQMLAIIETIMRVLGVDLESAKRMVCATPAVLLGGVSLATAQALEKRFAPLGAQLDVSQTASAAFDVAAEGADGPTRQALSALLPGAATARAAGAAGHFLAAGLSTQAAQQLWSELSRTSAKVRILNRDFQRFDVKLEAAPDTPEMRELLCSTTGMAESTAVKAVGKLPFVLAENVRGAELVELLNAVHARGGRATGTLLALLRFDLALGPGGDRAGARGWVAAIAGLAAAQEFDRPECSRLRGPFTKTQARWLQHELRKFAVPSRLVER